MRYRSVDRPRRAVADLSVGKHAGRTRERRGSADSRGLREQRHHHGSCRSTDRPGRSREAGHRVGERLVQRERHDEHAGREPRAKSPLQAPPTTKQERLDRRARRPEGGGHLVVSEPVDIAQHDGSALVVGQRGQLGVQLGRVGATGRLLICPRRDESGGVVECDRAASACRVAHLTLVAGDRAQPGGRLFDLDPGQKAAIGREKHLLGRVLGVGRIVKQRPAEPVDHPGVVGVELAQTRAGHPR